MKFITFLYPYDIRNIEAPHIWLLYKQLEKISPENLFCIGSNDYFNGKQCFKEEKRWEVNWAEKGWRVSDDITNKYVINKDIFKALESIEVTPNRVWSSLISEVYPPLVSALESYFEVIIQENSIDAIYTLCNCASLSQVSKKYNIPIIHIELGALRAPHYINTAYFDFKGVNGNTESKKRYEDCTSEENYKNKVPFLGREQLLGFIRRNNNDKAKGLIKKITRKIRSLLKRYRSDEYEIGLPLQVEDDSNMLSYSKGFNNIELISYAHKYFSKEKVLVRKHPGGHAHYKVENNDDSLSPYQFLDRCKRIVTINSSMGLEALLNGKPAWITGESPFSFCSSQTINLDEYQEAKNLDERLNFAVFGYLVPFDLLFDLEYINFRLNHPKETDIYLKHFNFWMHG